MTNCLLVLVLMGKSQTGFLLTSYESVAGIVFALWVFLYLSLCLGNVLWQDYNRGSFEHFGRHLNVTLDCYENVQVWSNPVQVWLTPEEEGTPVPHPFNLFESKSSLVTLTLTLLDVCHLKWWLTTMNLGSGSSWHWLRSHSFTFINGFVAFHWKYCHLGWEDVIFT